MRILYYIQVNEANNMLHSRLLYIESYCEFKQFFFFLKPEIGCKVHILISECFECPEDYFKCPRSFCLESRFVCDGNPNCQNGEDEENCGLFYPFNF